MDILKLTSLFRDERNSVINEAFEIETELGFYSLMGYFKCTNSSTILFVLTHPELIIVSNKDFDITSQ
jgi:hypothetical protein